MMKIDLKILLAIVAIALLPPSVALADEGYSAPKPAAGVTANAVEFTDGEVRKVDKDNKKLTIKHGEIKHLDMPGMTMVFSVKDAALLDAVKPGDKVKIKVEKTTGGFVVTELQAAQ